jgi:hypothetical protein
VEQELQQMNNQPNWAQKLQAVCACFTAAAAIAAVIGLFVQFRTYNESNLREDRRRSDEALGRLYSYEIDARKFLSNFPELREFLIDDPKGEKFRKLEHEQSDKSKKNLDRLRLVAGMYGNFFEYYLLIEPEINHHDSESIQKAFRNYMTRLLHDSYLLREHLLKYSTTWTEKLMTVVKAVEEESK